MIKCMSNEGIASACILVFFYYYFFFFTLIKVHYEVMKVFVVGYINQS